ncbi:MAG: peptidyl-prolyl cis-trans isomerase [Conexibacteraceae bacterium]|nr:peptidyl-prolyl cis-trans isomerase [Conexibacteraceae bacterium]
MRISRKLAALAAFFVIAVAVAACGGSSSTIPSGSVATVAGNPITLSAFNHWMYVAAKDQAAQAAQQGQVEPVIVANDPPEFKSCISQIRHDVPTLAKTPDATLRKDCNQVFTQFKGEVMAFLIEGYWYQGEAHRLGIKYTDEQLQKDFDKAKKAQFPTEAAFQTYLKSSGETKEDILFQVRVNQIFAKLLKKHERPVDDAAIQAYYEKHKTEFGTPESRDVHLIRIKTQADAQSAYNALKSGTSWDAVAKQYAEDASAKANGGLLQGVTNNQEEAAVNTQLFNNPVNKLLGPIKGIFGYYVAEVTKITPAKQEPLEKAKPTIKQLLTSQEQTAAQTRVNDTAKKHWQHRTFCRRTYSVSNCANYVAPRTTTTPAPTTPTTTTGNTTLTGTTTTGTGAATTTTGAGTTTTGH